MSRLAPPSKAGAVRMHKNTPPAMRCGGSVPVVLVMAARVLEGPEGPGGAGYPSMSPPSPAPTGRGSPASASSSPQSSPVASSSSSQSSSGSG